MASEDQLLAAAVAAKPFAAAGEAVVGVLVADPFEHGIVYLCALGPPAEDEDEDADEVPELGWIAVDGDGLALADSRRVQEAAMLAALCETAEEAALVPEAAEIAEAVDRALALVGDGRPELRAALGATREAALAAAVYDAACASRVRATSISWATPPARSARARRVCSRRGAELSAGLSGTAGRAGRGARPCRLGRARPDRAGGRAGALRRRARRGRAGHLGVCRGRARALPRRSGRRGGA